VIPVGTGIAVGLGGTLVLGSVLAWAGVWRSWTRSQLSGYAVLVMFPGVGLWLAGFGVSRAGAGGAGTALFAVGVPLVVLGGVLYLWEPRWLGPRWWRELDLRPQDDRQIADAIALAGPPPERHSERIARAARAPAVPVAVRRVALVDPAVGRPSAAHIDGVIHGRFLLYADEIVFVAGPGDDALRPGPTIRVLDPTTITAVRAPRERGQRRTLRLATTDTTHPWEIRAERRDALLDDLFVHYGHRRSRSA